MPTSSGGDAYSNTAIDLNKLKVSVPKTIPFEHKTEE